MSEFVISKENEEYMVSFCRTIRKLAQLNKLIIEGSYRFEIVCKRLFKFADYCGVKKFDFAKNYLSNLQPYMIYKNPEKESLSVDISYGVSLKIKFPIENKVIVVFSDNNENSSKYGKEKVRIIADAITGEIKDTNVKTFEILFPQGIISIPLALYGELQADGTFLTHKSLIDKAIIENCNQYIQDLYTSNLDFSLLDNVEIFSALQQIPYTPQGNTVFSNISVLIDNMSVQDSPIHRQCAGFALMAYVERLLLTKEQKEELLYLINEKYVVPKQNEKEAVINLLLSVINNMDTVKLIVDNDI